MTDPEPAPQRSFLLELKNRQVYQAAVAYAVVAWGVTEILDGVVARLGWPDWLATLAVIVFVVGFPVAMFLAWVFDWTPAGIRRTEPWTAMGWVSIVAAGGFLVAGTAGLFWLINPGGLARVEQVGVAVLPCRYRGDADTAFRGEGLAQTIHERLAHLKALRVPAFASVMRASAQNMPTAQLGAVLGVDRLVECRVVHEKDRLQLEVSLVDVDSDDIQPIIDLDLQASEVFMALDTATQSLAEKLDVSLTQDERQRLVESDTSSVRGFDAWLVGEQAMRKGTADGYREAREYFKAAQIADGFELAQVREADAMMALLKVNPPGTDAGIAANLRAVDLMLDEVERKNPTLAELYVARMRLAGLSADLSAGEDQQRVWFERAVDLKPSYAAPYRFLGEYLLGAGKTAEAEELLERARVLDPALRAGE